MSATARDYQSPNPPSTEGLDHLFQLTDQVEIQDQFQVEQAEFQIQDQVELSEIQDQFQLEQAGFQIQDHLEPVEIQDQFTELVFNEYKEQIKSLQQKLESATYRIGYLQHHVESQDLQIKLLTDSQHKPGRWQRFRSWFFGQ